MFEAPSVLSRFFLLKPFENNKTTKQATSEEEVSKVSQLIHKELPSAT
jgi:hypothetical protein